MGCTGKRRGLGPRNDVHTTFKAVALPGGQQIIAWSIIFLFPKHRKVNVSQMKYFRSEKRTTSNHAPLVFSHIVLILWYWNCKKNQNASNSLCNSVNSKPPTTRAGLWSIEFTYYKKKNKKKKNDKKSRNSRPWYPRTTLEVNIYIFGLTKCTLWWNTRIFPFIKKNISSSRAVRILFLSFTYEDIGVAMVTNMIKK